MTQDGNKPTEKTGVSFGEFLGIELIEAKDGVARTRMAIDERHVHPGGVQGGVFMTFMDSSVHHAVTSALGEGEFHATIEFKVNFLRPGKKGDILTATASIINKGRRVAVADVEVRNQSGDLLCKSLSTEAVITGSR